MTRYQIAAGTSVLVRKQTDWPNTWRTHIVKESLDLGEPTRSDIIGLTFEHDSWWIFAAPDQVTELEDEQEEQQQLEFAFAL